MATATALRRRRARPPIHTSPESSSRYAHEWGSGRGGTVVAPPHTHTTDIINIVGVGVVWFSHHATTDAQRTAREREESAGARVIPTYIHILERRVASK